MEEVRADVTQFNGCKSIRSDLTSFGFGSGGSSPTPTPTTPTIFDYVPEFGFITESNMSIGIGKDFVKGYWNGGVNIGVTIHSKEKLDFTDINTIKCKVNITSIYPNFDCYIGLKSNISTVIGDFIASDKTRVIGEDVELTVDTSEITGEYYLVISPVGANATFTELTFN